MTFISYSYLAKSLSCTLGLMKEKVSLSGIKSTAILTIILLLGNLSAKNDI